MAQEDIVHVDRGPTHTRVASYVPMRIVEISPTVIAGSGGAIPYNSYWGYSRQGIPDVQQGDRITSTINGYQYRVSGNPSIKDSSFLRVMLERILVATP